MTVKQQWMIVLGIVAVLLGGAFTASHFLKDELTSVTVGSDAPGFAAKTLTQPAAMKSLTNYRGEVVLLNIWATWCAPCRIEMPSMERLQQRLGPKGLRIVAVSVDDPGMEAKINAFADELSLSFELLYDAPGRIRQQYQTTGVPETFIIGRDGTIRRRIIGADDWSSEANVAFLERLLAEPKP